MKRVILFGAPGAGKGTQAEFIRSRFGFVKISAGDLIRTEVESDSELGRCLKSIIEKGELVSDEIIIEMVNQRLNRGDIQEGYILDGFPRTIPQAKALEKLKADKDFIFYLKIGDPTRVVGRVVTRLTCSNCGATFSTITNKPKQDGVCDLCGGELAMRSDDQAETISHRIEIYRQSTKPVIDFFRRQGVLIEIDATATIETVTATIGGFLS
jgi:adenylate kinase